MPKRARPHALGALLTALAATAIVAPNALAASLATRDAPRLRTLSDGAQRASAGTPFLIGFHHGQASGHLPPVQENMQLVGELNLISPSTSLPVAPDQVADVAVHKGFAYLNSWDSPTCTDGGTFVVDIRDPSKPKQVGFIPTSGPYYHGEGAHVVSISTPQFTGDLLAVNNEAYGANQDPAPGCAPADRSRGGFDLYDVTNPAQPKILVQNAGDRSPTGSLVQNPAIPGNSYHSVFVWQDGPRAYLVGVDNTEFSDVDIWDITDPKVPEFIRDFDPFTLPEVNDIASLGANGNNFFHHDVVVKRIGTQMRMLLSYWDGGYVQLNVNNPKSPSFITDTDYDEADPLTGYDPPEGNAHQAEYSADDQFILAADEDFSPFRLIGGITQAPYAGEGFSGIVINISDGQRIQGDTVFVGDACTSVIAPPAGVIIAIAERGACSFQTQADVIDDAGYAMAIIMNNSFGPGEDRCDKLNFDIMIAEGSVDIPILFVPRTDGFRMLNVYNANTYQCTGAATPTAGDTPAPAVGTGGLTMLLASVFDGWGYTHLYDANTDEEIDAYAIPEALNASHAGGSGVLSVHEFATDPTTNLAYASYYAGGMRVFRFSRANGLEPVGKYIDPNGSYFWGVEQFTDAAGNRLIAGSDRDFGLQIFKYTGPGAVLAPPPGPPAPPPPPPPPPAQPPPPPAQPPPPPVAPRPSSNFSLGSLSRVTFVRRRARITITVPGRGAVAASVRARIGGRLRTLASTRATPTRAGSVRLTFRLSLTNSRLLRRTLARRPTRRMSGTVRVSYTPTGGSRRTRSKSVSIGMR